MQAFRPASFCRAAYKRPVSAFNEGTLGPNRVPNLQFRWHSVYKEMRHSQGASPTGISRCGDQQSSMQGRFGNSAMMLRLGAFAVLGASTEHDADGISVHGL